MRKHIVLKVTEQDIKTKKLYKLAYNPIVLAGYRQFKKIVDIYDGFMWIGGKKYAMTPRTKELFLKSQADHTQVKPCELAFTLQT